MTRIPCDPVGWDELETIYGDLHRIAVCHARRSTQLFLRTFCTFRRE